MDFPGTRDHLPLLQRHPLHLPYPVQLVSDYGREYALTPSNLGETGLAFFALGLGMVIGTATQPLFILSIKDKALRAGGKAPPEARLPVGMAGAILAPAGLLWFSLSSFSKMPWIMPMIGTLIFGIGVS